MRILLCAWLNHKMLVTGWILRLVQWLEIVLRGGQNQLFPRQKTIEKRKVGKDGGSSKYHWLPPAMHWYDNLVNLLEAKFQLVCTNYFAVKWQKETKVRIVLLKAEWLLSIDLFVHFFMFMAFEMLSSLLEGCSLQCQMIPACTQHTRTEKRA